jgi:WD40 repeat protein
MNMAFAPNNQLVASGSRESKVYVWRIPDEPVDGLYEPITIISTDETGTPSVFFSADSDIVIITTPDDMLSFWDISSCIEDNEEE